jgi:hypothetical protein
VIDPGEPPVTLFEAIPEAEVTVAGRPVTVPAPLSFLNKTEWLEELTMLPAASSIVAVSVRGAPDVRFVVELEKTSFLAAPGTTANVVVAEVSPLAVARIVIEPAMAPAMCSKALWDEDVTVPSPVTVPMPSVFANVTEWLPPEVTRLPAASSIVTFSCRDAPEASAAVELAYTSFAGAPGLTLNAVVPELRPAVDAVTVTDPARLPVATSVATPCAAKTVPSPVTLPAPPVWENVTLALESTRLL